MTEDARPSPLAIWVEAARPRTLGAAFAPVFVGACLAYADGVLDPLVVAACLMGAVSIQIGTNFANDYFDFLKGADTEDRVGPVRATAAGWVTPAQMRLATVLAFLTLVPSAVVLVAAAGWPLVVIGVLSVLCGVAYTGGPYPLAYLGLGDAFVLVFFGPVAVGGTYFAQSLTVTPQVLVAGLMPGLIATALLAVNNLRDVHTDRVADKRTLAVRFGETFAKLEIAVCLFVPIVVIPVALVVDAGGHYGALASLLAVVPAISITRRAFTEEGRALIPVLEDIGKTLLLQSVLFGLGWALT
ncbi:MAG: 1,4-dihydroxy-2-naphthoate polyprenyltransferase [Myxococcota bacterium]